MLRTPEARLVGTITAVGGSSFTVTPIAGESDGGTGITTVVVNTSGAPVNVRVTERVSIRLAALEG